MADRSTIRAILALTLILGVWLCVRFLLAALLPAGATGAPVRVAISAVALLVAIVFVRALVPSAPSPLRWLRIRHAPAELAIGVCLGLVLMSLVFGALLVLGWYEFVRVETDVTAVLVHLGVWSLIAAYEELLFRGVVLGGLIQLVGPLPALALSALIFGAAHVGGNIHVAGGLLIAVGGGLLFGACALAARSLWLPVGVHLGWNFAQSALFGIPAPGLSLPAGSSIGTVTGPSSYAGMTASVETGWVAAIVAAVAGLLVLSLGRDRLGTGAWHRVQAPWRRRR